MKRMPALFTALLLTLLLLLPGAAWCEETVTVMGVRVPADAQQLTLSKLKLDGIQRITKEVQALPKLQSLTLDHPTMSYANMGRLMKALPDIKVNYLIKWNTIEVDTGAETLDLGRRRTVTYDDLKTLMGLMPNLKDVSMENVYLGLGAYLKLVKAFPDVLLRTNVPVYDTYILYNSQSLTTRHSGSSKRGESSEFRTLCYVPDLLALDLGHNAIRDLSFLQSFPHMRILTLADNYITDLTEIGKLTELEFLEIFSNRISDLTPLANLTNLMDLNLCSNRITDASPLYGLKNLKRLWIANNKLSQSQIEELQRQLPDTLIVTKASHETGAGWRQHPHYYEIIDIYNSRVYQPLSRD